MEQEVREVIRMNAKTDWDGHGKFSLQNCLFILITAFIFQSATATELLFKSPDGGRVTLNVKKQQVTAKDDQNSIAYKVAPSISKHLKRAEDVRLIGNPSNPESPIFIVMTREPSRPNAMGRGYCGAGYEDYLLLVEILEQKLFLRDRFLLQSCLKSISMYIDQGDDHPKNGLIDEKNGSLSYRLVDDDADKKRTLTVSDKHFKTGLVQDPDNK